MLGKRIRKSTQTNLQQKNKTKKINQLKYEKQISKQHWYNY